MSQPLLTKSKYLAGLQCDKRIWLEIHDETRASPPDRAAQRLFEQGQQVGVRAQSLFPNGVLIARDHPVAAIQGTWEAIEAGEHTIYEGVFQHDNVLVIADILTKEGDSWHLIEVKMSTKVKAEHKHDVAVQKYVLEKSGLPIAKASVMLINSADCYHPDLSNLFYLEDVTADLANYDVAPQLKHFYEVLGLPDAPEVIIGRHCDKPRECAFKAYCWEPYGDQTIFHAPGLHYKKIDRLRNQGIIQMADIPTNYDLSTKEREGVERIVQQGVDIDLQGIKRLLDTLEYPLHFLDFETDNPPIPKYPGARPYQQIPFQFSCHILHENGTLEHREYLHTDETDPRQQLVDRLVETTHRSGSIIAYNASFERGVLKDLAKKFPNYADTFHNMIDRLWDQLDVFKKYYKHHGFRGSNSIKSVLSTLFPDLTYDDLAVSGGTEAQAAWSDLVWGNGENSDEIVTALKDYCRLDTLAMVKLHENLGEITSA